MNKYLLRGILLLAAGAATLYGGYQLQGNENHLYKVVMVLGILLFGFGFILILYSFFRKIDRHTLLEQRKDKRS